MNFEPSLEGWIEEIKIKDQEKLKFVQSFLHSTYILRFYPMINVGKSRKQF